jgi:SNF2 family DNA or RNA helicase
MPSLKNRIGVVMPGMKAKDRTDVLEAFTDAFDDKGKHRQTRNNLILIGTTRLIGKGLQLTRAAHMVLMEPEYEFVNELQAYGRIHRIGQMNPCSYSYRLINSASEIERRIVERQKARKESVGVQVDAAEVEGMTRFATADDGGADV